MDSKERAHLILTLRKKLPNASISVCKKIMDEYDYDMEKGYQKLLEIENAKQGTNIETHYGIVISDVVSLDSHMYKGGVVGCLIALGCQTPTVEQDPFFVQAADSILLAALKHCPITMGQLMDTELVKPISDMHNNTPFLLSTVMDILKYLKLKFPEITELKEYKILKKSKDALGVYNYNHHTGKAAGIGEFKADRLIDHELEDKFNKVLATATCYNPLCVHDYEIPNIVLQTYKNDITIDVGNEMLKNGKITPQELIEELDKRVNQFMQETVLDLIKIDDKSTVQEFMRNNKFRIADFERYKII